MADDLKSPLGTAAEFPGVTRIATREVSPGRHAIQMTQSPDDPLTGAVNETAPASDTAASGLNGRLQRIAQRLTTMLGADGTVTPAAVALSANTSAVLLAANANRVRFRIHNPLASDLYVRMASSAPTAAAGGYDFVVPANGGQYLSDPLEYSGQLRGICATAGSINVSESV